jgi:hypothetical protein
MEEISQEAVSAVKLLGYRETVDVMNDYSRDCSSFGHSTPLYAREPEPKLQTQMLNPVLHRQASTTLLNYGICLSSASPAAIPPTAPGGD